MKARVQESPVLVNKIKEEEDKSRKAKDDILKRLNSDQKNYEYKKREIEENVAQRPLLVEQG